MPQVVDFPALALDSRTGLSVLVRVCKETPVAGEPFREFRSRLRAAKLWDREKPATLLRWLGVGGATIVPSSSMRAIADAASEEALAAAVLDRMWECNPLLLKTVRDLLAERAYHKDEVSKHLNSIAYRGVVPSRPNLEVWLQAAIIAGLLKPVGIAVALGSAAEAFAARCADFDVDEFLETDKPWADPVIPSLDDDAAPADVMASDTAAVVAATAPEIAPAGPVLPSPLRHLSADGVLSPRGRDRAVPLVRFSHGFSAELLDETATKLAAWWAEAGVATNGYTPADFGLDQEAWVEGADEVIYRVAVAASLVFRLERDRNAVIAAFKALDGAGVLADLYQGNVPDSLPNDVDAKSLMLASLAARRCAEAPELAATIERKPTAAEALVVLESALGRGLFRIELFWMLDVLAKLGVIRFEDLGDVTTPPYRIVRDTLFRLGFIESPYASTPAELTVAAKAARRAAGAAPAPELLATFAMAAGCSYDCSHRKSCDFACRERLE
jgi:hypothetical protein